jgi:class 3 adenylate cyclase
LKGISVAASGGRVALAEREALLRDSARHARLREQLIAPSNAILAYGQLLHDQAPGGSREAGYLGRIVASARQVADRLAAAGAALGEAGDDLPLLRRLRHDLRSPLGAIKGFAELLLEDGAPVPREDLERLVERVVEILQRVDELAAGAGPEEGAAELAAALAATAGSLPDATAGKPGRILVIDDNEDNRLLLQDILTVAGHEVALADSGAAGLSWLERQPADLVLLDLLMPEMNGLEVLLALRRPDPADLPVLVLSGVDHSEMTAQCLAAGAQDFVRKPFDTAILRARIAAALERKRLRDRERLYLARLDAEKHRAEALLDNILPAAVTARLGRGERTIADRIEPVTVLFADVVGFTKIAARLSTVRLVADLDRLVSAFDELAAELGVEKIKTVGDAYLAVAGVPEARPDHADAAAELALRMTETTTALAPDLGADYRLRIGLHSGAVLAGVIGRRKFSYDVWGDTVNVASRLQQLSAPDAITISDATRAAISCSVQVEALGKVELRGRGSFATFRLSRAVG